MRPVIAPALHPAAARAPAALRADGHRPIRTAGPSPVRLFSRRGNAALARLAATRSVLVFDLEGTLVPDRPAGQAGVQALTAARMRALAHVWPVAVLARRASEDARSRLGFEPTVLAYCADTDGMSYAPDKAGALRHVLRQTGAAWALVVGDDADDEPAFAVAPMGSVTVRIGTTVHLPTAAAYRLETQSQVTVLLSTLLALRCGCAAMAREPRLCDSEQTCQRC